MAQEMGQRLGERKASHFGPTLIVTTIAWLFGNQYWWEGPAFIIGVIAAVRHILTVGASLTLESSKSSDAFNRSIYEMGLNALIVVALVFAIFLSKAAHRKRT